MAQALGGSNGAWVRDVCEDCIQPDSAATNRWVHPKASHDVLVGAVWRPVEWEASNLWIDIDVSARPRFGAVPLEDSDTYDFRGLSSDNSGNRGTDVRV
jgi:hypothetical protein